ncbi:MAG: hypothetical protein QOK43_133 [Acidimicrobiaceae bacterium]|nr:hypothetical protein [Acidimicrobiaceae bacterium]
MSDLLALAIVVAFFALASLFVAACERIVGDDETAPEVVAAAEPTVVGL